MDLVQDKGCSDPTDNCFYVYLINLLSNLLNIKRMKISYKDLPEERKEILRERALKNYYNNREKYIKVASEYNKEYYKENKDIILKKRKEYYNNNKEDIAERVYDYNKNYYQENKDNILEIRREYRIKNRDKIMEFRRIRDYYNRDINYYNKVMEKFKLEGDKVKYTNVEVVFLDF